MWDTFGNLIGFDNDTQADKIAPEAAQKLVRTIAETTPCSARESRNYQAAMARKFPWLSDVVVAPRD